MHTTYSDGLDSVEKMVMSAVDKQLDVIAITDHDTFAGSLAAEKFIKDKKIEIILIFGNEIRARYLGKLMDILILCPKKPVGEAPKDALRLYDWAERQGCLYVPAHPYDERRYGCGEMIYDLEMHAIEGWNARAPKKINERALETAKILGKPVIANSDAHDAEMIAAAHTIIESDKDPDEILHAILKGKTKIVRGNISPKSYARYVSKKLVRRSVRHLFLKK